MMCRCYMLFQYAEQQHAGGATCRCGRQDGSMRSRMQAQHAGAACTMQRAGMQMQHVGAAVCKRASERERERTEERQTERERTGAEVGRAGAGLAGEGGGRSRWSCWNSSDTFRRAARGGPRDMSGIGVHWRHWRSGRALAFRPPRSPGSVSHRGGLPPPRGRRSPGGAARCGADGPPLFKFIKFICSNQISSSSDLQVQICKFRSVLGNRRPRQCPPLFNGYWRSAGRPGPRGW